MDGFCEILQDCLRSEINEDKQVVLPPFQTQVMLRAISRSHKQQLNFDTISSCMFLYEISVTLQEHGQSYCTLSV